MSEEHMKRIAERAHALWKQAGEPHGRDVEHWLEAERALGEAPPPAAETPPPKKRAAPRKKQPA